MGEEATSTAMSATYPVVEPMTGIEPAYLAWEASALPLSYIGECVTECSHPAG